MWIVENSSFDRDSTYNLLKSLKKLKIPYIDFEYKLFMNWKDVYEGIGDIDSNVISYGSLNFINKIQKIESYKPGSYCNFRNLECKNYYTSKLLPYLLNSKYYIMTWEFFKLKAEYLFKEFEGKIFIRPNSGKKVFTGMVVYEDSYLYDFSTTFNRVEDNTLVIVAPVKEVTKEWRFFVSKNNVITGCQFYENGKLYVNTKVDKEAKDLAKLVSNLYNPDLIFVVDIGKTNEDVYKVIELNSFSCAGIYACDTDKIVLEVNKNLNK